MVQVSGKAHRRDRHKQSEMRIETEQLKDLSQARRRQRAILKSTSAGLRNPGTDCLP